MVLPFLLVMKKTNSFIAIEFIKNIFNWSVGTRCVFLVFMRSAGIVHRFSSNQIHPTAGAMNPPARRSSTAPSRHKQRPCITLVLLQTLKELGQLVPLPSGWVEVCVVTWRFLTQVQGSGSSNHPLSIAWSKTFRRTIKHLVGLNPLPDYRLPRLPVQDDSAARSAHPLLVIPGEVLHRCLRPSSGRASG